MSAPSQFVFSTLSNPIYSTQVREVYQNRIALEREYSGKLLLLANKATEKKSKKIAVLVLGEEPTKAWGEEDVRNRCDLLASGTRVSQILMYYSTLGRAYTQLIQSFSESALDHVDLADGLESKVVNLLKVVEKRHEEAKKKARPFGTIVLPHLTSDLSK